MDFDAVEIHILWHSLSGTKVFQKVRMSSQT